VRRARAWNFAAAQARRMRAGAMRGHCELASVRELRRLSCKKAGEIIACLLRTDKVFVYFTRLKRRASESVEEEAAQCRDDAAADRKNGTQIRTNMHKTTPFFFDRLA
jgi:hypothetical protein